MYTYQDYIYDKEHSGIVYAVTAAITAHKNSAEYKIACDADNYDRQQNTTITRFIKKLYDEMGRAYVDLTAQPNRICSNFFTRLNTQRRTYSLGNGIFFNDFDKEILGKDFDVKIGRAGYYALIHGKTFVFVNVDKLHIFKLTEFKPLYDEKTGALMAGVRWWQVDTNKPLMVEVYEIEGVTMLSKEADSEMRVIQEQQPYILKTITMPAMEEIEIVGGENWDGRLPIIEMQGNRNAQSTLVGMKGSIDAYDLVRSGFADDLTECSEIYWIVNGAGGMNSSDLERFKNRLKTQHIANITDGDEVTVTPYTQPIPYEARKEFLAGIRAGIYEDFGGLDVHAVAAGATNDHIDAAYQPLDENADDYEEQIIEALQHLLALLGVEDKPYFKRNRISNEKETTEMILDAANYLDDETVLNHLPFISEEEVQRILDVKAAELAAKYKLEPPIDEPNGAV